MIYKRNRLYFNDTEIIRIDKFLMNWHYTPLFEGDIIAPDLKEFLKLIQEKYKIYHYILKIKNPNLDYMMIDIKYTDYNKKELDQTKKYSKLQALKTYINLYKNDEI